MPASAGMTVVTGMTGVTAVTVVAGMTGMTVVAGMTAVTGMAGMTGLTGSGLTLHIAWHDALARCGALAGMPYPVNTTAPTATMKTLLLLTVALLGSGCAAPTPAGPVTDLRTALARWEAAAPSEYRFDFQRICECLPAWTDPVTIEVRNQDVVSVVSRNSGEPVDLDGTVRWYAIEELFTLIEAIDAEGQRLIVDYHASGYPLRIEVGTPANDAGYVLTIGNLVAV
ncbi:MAG: DUF6174 domain-containing protein [Gemmatimonadota bacterium]